MPDNINQMTNSEFVDFCYTTILRRTADAEGKSYYTDALDGGHLNREEVLLALVSSEEFQQQSKCKEFVYPGPFYSVIPSESEFVDFCYTTILRRTVDIEGKSYYTDALDGGHLNREEVLLAFLNSEELQKRSTCKEFVYPGHFYSVIPSEEVAVNYEKEKFYDDPVLGIDINDVNQRKLIDDFRQYHDECPFPDEKSDFYRYHFINPAYSYGDALCLYSMMCHFQPRKIVEVGSGYSSCVMLDTNDIFFDGKIDITFIEPFPKLLYSLMKAGDEEKYQVHPTAVQNVDLEIFKQLEENDILFIDSTHVSKLSSDVNRILFDILPSLNKGVIIHIHDIFWPFEYPDDWIQEGRYWNEAYLLRSFLEFNSSFEIMLFTDYLWVKYPGWLKESLPLFRKNPGGSIWLRKVK